MDRTLTLRRNHLTELATDELAEVGGGDAITQHCNTIHFCAIPTLPLAVCLERR